MSSWIFGPSPRGGVAGDADDGGEQLADIDRRRVLARELGVEAGGVGDVGDQPVEALDVVLDDAR